MGRAGLYIPQHTRDVLDYLSDIAALHGWPVATIIWCWTDVLTAMADGEVDLVLTTSLTDLPPDRHPKLVFADEQPPLAPDPTRPVIRW